MALVGVSTRAVFQPIPKRTQAFRNWPSPCDNASPSRSQSPFEDRPLRRQTPFRQLGIDTCILMDKIVDSVASWDRHRKGSRSRYAGWYQLTGCNSASTSLVSFAGRVSFEGRKRSNSSPSSFPSPCVTRLCLRLPLCLESGRLSCYARFRTSLFRLRVLAGPQLVLELLPGPDSVWTGQGLHPRVLA